MTNAFTLITGASSGIGERCAIEHSQNRRIILSGRNYEKLDVVRQKCYNPDNHLIWCEDLANNRMDIFQSLNSFIVKFDIVIESFIHCAGVTKILPIRNFTIQYIDEIFNTNIFSAIEILRVLLKKDNKGSLTNIIFISGLWSIRGDKGNSIYAASKGAINSLVCSLAQELAPKVRVNAILPGAVVTPMTESLLLNSELGQMISKDYPLGLGAIEDIVNYILFLLSDKSRWVTGQNIVIDGGRSTK